MSNAQGRTIYYKPRISEMDAYDMLPESIRTELQNSVTSWDSYAVLRMFKKLCKTSGPKTAARLMCTAIVDWNRQEIRDGKKTWCKHLRKPGMRWSAVQDSPHNIAYATFLGGDE